MGVVETAAGISFSLVAGVAVDSFNRRRLMILSDVVRGAALVFLVGYLLLTGFNLLVILIVGFIIASFSVLFQPSENAVMPEIVGGANVSKANGLVRSSRSIATMVGDGIAGVMIVTIGAIVGLAYNSITFFASAILIAAVATGIGKSRPKSKDHKSSYFGDLKEGFAWLKSNKGLLELTGSAFFLNFFFSMAVTYMVVFVTRGLNEGGLTFGIVLALTSLGEAAGALSVGRVGAARYAGKAWTLGYGMTCGTFLLIMAVFANVYVTGFCALLIGFFAAFGGTAWLSAAQIMVPSEMQGRYFGIDQLGSIAILPVAQIAGALIINSLGILHGFEIAALGMIMSAAGFIALADLRNLRAIPPNE